jgi:O-antigen biosynthesis protein
VLAKAHHPQQFVDRIAGIVTAPHPATPAQRMPRLADAGAGR